MARPPRMLARLCLVPLVAGTLAGCHGAPMHEARRSNFPSPSASASASASASPTATPVLATRTVPILLPAAGSAGAARWAVQMVVPYGAPTSLLGQADSHGGRSTAWGPAYGAPAADGTWWFMDLQKRRLAHYSSAGRFLRAVPIPGRYVPLESLHVFADGSMWAPKGLRVDDSMVSDGATARRVAVADASERVWIYDDGRKAYALPRQPGTPVATLQIVAGTPVLGQADAMRTPAGQRFAAYLADPNSGPLIVELPDAPRPMRLVLPYRSAAKPAARVFAFIEAEAAADGTIHVLVFGSTDGPQPADVGGLLTITPDGAVSPVLAVPSLFSAAAPGEASHLHIDPTTNRPSLVVDGNHALRVYRLDR